MTRDSYTTIEFRDHIRDVVLESVPSLPIPRVGETVEVGARITADGERLDPGTTDWKAWEMDGEYETVLEGEVVDVTRHYHRGHGREELTVYVDLEVAYHDD